MLGGEVRCSQVPDDVLEWHDNDHRLGLAIFECDGGGGCVQLSQESVQLLVGGLTAWLEEKAKE